MNAIGNPFIRIPGRKPADTPLPAFSRAHGYGLALTNTFKDG
jgi:hypothetical protein